MALRPWGSPFVAHVRLHEAFSGLPAYGYDALLLAYLQGAAYRPLGEEAYQAYMSPWQGEVGQAAFYRQIAQRYTDEIEDRYELLDWPVDTCRSDLPDWERPTGKPQRSRNDGVSRMAGRWENHRPV